MIFGTRTRRDGERATRAPLHRALLACGVVVLLCTAAQCGATTPPPKPEPGPNPGPNPLSLVANGSRVTFTGWGASLAWWAELAGNWRQDVERALVQRIFGRTDQDLGLTVVRFNLGAGIGDPTCLPMRPGAAIQNYAADGAQRSVLADALAQIGKNRATVEIFANSPPLRLLTKKDGKTCADGSSTLSPVKNDAYAKYLAKAADDLITSGVPVTSIEAFNEPNSNFWPGERKPLYQEGANIDPSQETDILARLCTKISNDPLLVAHQVKIGTPDGNSPDKVVPAGLASLTQACLGHVNTHSYGTDPYPGRGPDKRVDLQQSVAQLSSKPSLWMSEFGLPTGVGLPTGGDTSKQTTIQAAEVARDQAVALTKQITDDLNLLGAAAWVYWQPVENIDAGSWGLLKIDFNNPAPASGGPDIQDTKSFYAFAQYTRFIPPHSQIIQWSGAYGDLGAGVVAAIRPDGSVAIVVSDSANDKALRVNLGTLGIRRLSLSGTYRTDEANAAAPFSDPNAVVNSDGTFSTTMTPRTVTTYILTPTGQPTATTTSAPPVAPTKLITFQPWVPQAPTGISVPMPGAILTKTTGTCAGGSPHDPGRDTAFRCTSTDPNVRADPCFANFKSGDPSSSLLCSTDPTTMNLVYLDQAGGHLSMSNANTEDPNTPPWFVILSDGLKCHLTTGTDTQYLTYDCGGGTGATVPDRSAPTWTVREGKFIGPAVPTPSSARVAVTTAYR